MGGYQVERPPQISAIHASLTLTIDGSKQMAFKIQKNDEDIFMISNQLNKNYDAFVKALITNDMFQEVPLKRAPVQVVIQKNVKQIEVTQKLKA